jgi:3-methyl-2-oxobutanoate hydroxymethyltransferase
MISLYDAPTATLCCDAGVDCLLVGDSLGNVILGYDDFLSVTMEDLMRHTAAVARGAKKSSHPLVPVVADLPFGSYTSVRQATRNGAALVRAGAHAVKLEGAGPTTLRAVRALVEMGAPVVGHLGFTPQSVLNFSGVVQGKTARPLGGCSGMRASWRRLDAPPWYSRPCRERSRSTSRRVSPSPPSASARGPAATGRYLSGTIWRG